MTALSDPPESAPPTDTDDLLQTFLARTNEVCPSCRYDLHRLTGRHCPECGQALVLRVGLESPNLGAFVSGLIALALPTGFGGLFFLFFIAAWVVDGGGYLDAEIFFNFLGVTVVSGGLLLTWLVVGRWVRRRDRPTRILLALLCWGYPILPLWYVYVVLGAP